MASSSIWLGDRRRTAVDRLEANPVNLDRRWAGVSRCLSP